MISEETVARLSWGLTFGTAGWGIIGALNGAISIFVGAAISDMILPRVGGLFIWYIFYVVPAGAISSAAVAAGGTALLGHDMKQRLIYCGCWNTWYSIFLIAIVWRQKKKKRKVINE